jgi:NAD(P)-dependent dehydrogenase (short-subunit alcohol dehydrogenase family)
MPTLLIIGASRGLGLEFVRQYAADGWRVIATVRDPLHGRAASEAGAEVSLCDVAQPAAIDRLAAGLAGTTFDMVIHNAGIFGENQEIDTLDPQGFIEVMRVNALAPLLVARAFADRLSGRKLFAVLSSKMGSIADNDSGGLYAYRASKAALNMGIKSLSVDLAGSGVTVLALSPGWVRTEMGGSNAPLDPPSAVAGLRRVLDSAGPADSGTFVHYDGTRLPW